MNRLRTWLLLSLCIFATSCVTQRACLEKFPPRDTTYVTYHDTVYFVTVESDTIYEHGTIHDTVYASTGTAGGQAWVYKDTLYLNVWQKDTIIAYRDSIMTVYKDKIVTIQEKPKFNGVMWQIIALAFILLIVVGLIKLVR